MKQMSAKTGNYLKGRARGMSASTSFHSEVAGTCDNYVVEGHVNNVVPTVDQFAVPSSHGPDDAVKIQPTFEAQVTDCRFNPKTKQNIFKNAVDAYKGVTADANKGVTADANMEVEKVLANRKAGVFGSSKRVDFGPQKSPSSVAKIRAESAQVKREMKKCRPKKGAGSR